jgi:transcriptional regulatory protein RtcR
MQIVSLLGKNKDNFTANDSGVFSPTVALALQADTLGAHALRVLFTPSQHAQVAMLRSVLLSIAPLLLVHWDEVANHDAFDPVAASAALMDVVSEWDEDDTYAFSLGTGSHVHLHLWFKIVESGFLNATLLQVVNAKKSTVEARTHHTHTFFPGRVKVMDVRLSCYESMERRLLKQSVDGDSYLKNGIATKNDDYNALIALIEKVGTRSAHPLLLTGPTGAGKTALAKRIYQLKRDRSSMVGQWVALNCATLTESHAMSVLFGHQKGAFTGAMSTREGLLAKARGGVLFLDEVATLPLPVQSMLLHALDTGEYYPMGADTPTASVFTLICGTNEDLTAAVGSGLFRDDLLARIDTWHFRLPGLAQRKEDIGPNLDFELQRLRHEEQTRVKFTAVARHTFIEFALSYEATWKRNFRDLRSAVIRMATLAEDHTITEAVVNNEIARLKQQWHGAPGASRTPEHFKASLTYLEYETLCIVFAVCQRSRNATEAAKTLYANEKGETRGVNPASRLANYLNKLSLDFDTIKRWK